MTRIPSEGSAAWDGQDDLTGSPDCGRTASSVDDVSTFCTEGSTVVGAGGAIITGGTEIGIGKPTGSSTLSDGKRNE